MNGGNVELIAKLESWAAAYEAGETDRAADAESLTDHSKTLREAIAALSAQPRPSIDYSGCCDTPAYCSSARRCTAKDASPQPNLNEPFGSSEQLREALSGFLSVSFTPEFDGCPDEVKRAYRHWHGRLVQFAGAMDFEVAIGAAQEVKP